MKYLQLICIESQTDTPEAAAAMREHVGAWVDETVARGVNIVGKPLDAPATAKTVRVRDGETLVSDGPFSDTKEFIGGLDILECENLDEAIEVAAKHPVSWFHAIELRPFTPGLELPAEWGPMGTGTGESRVPRDQELRYLLMICDGAGDPPEVVAEVIRERDGWREPTAGKLVLGHGLEPPASATTVRVRDGQTLLTDGPFTETKEFLAGIGVLNTSSEQEAIELAAMHPLARFHAVEVRRFVDL